MLQGAPAPEDRAGSVKGGERKLDRGASLREGLVGRCPGGGRLHDHPHRYPAEKMQLLCCVFVGRVPWLARGANGSPFCNRRVAFLAAHV